MAPPFDSWIGARRVVVVIEHCGNAGGPGVTLDEVKSKTEAGFETAIQLA